MMDIETIKGNLRTASLYCSEQNDRSACIDAIMLINYLQDRLSAAESELKQTKDSLFSQTSYSREMKSLWLDAKQASDQLRAQVEANAYELELHRADHSSMKALGWESVGEMVSSYKTLSGQSVEISGGGDEQEKRILYLESELESAARIIKNFIKPSPNKADVPEGKEIQVCKIGSWGSAYDMPENTRAYTYKDQPGNSIASRIGKALVVASKEKYGDQIDQGLSLLKSLYELNLGVFQLPPLKDE